MTVKELIERTHSRAVCIPHPEAAIAAGYTSDLLSDVVANCPEESALITLQAHANTVAAATLVGITAIMITGGREIPEDMIAAAKNEGIAIISTSMNQFDASFAVKTALLS